MTVKKISCMKCENNCFIKSCSPAWLGSIDMEKYWLQYPKRQYIIREGDPVLGVYFVHKGKVKVTSSGIKGKEQIVRFAIDGHIVGHRGLGAEKYPINAMTMEESLLCLIDNSMLYKLFMNNPKFTYELMQYYATELRKTEIRMKYLAQMNTREKVAEALLFLENIFGTTSSGHLKVSTSRQELAEIAGTNNEQISRQLSDFENENLIKRDKKDIRIIDKNGILQIIKDFGSYELFNENKNKNRLN